MYVLSIVFLATGCSGVKTFTTAARSGETVVLAMGWQQHLKRANMTVTIIDSSGAKTVYMPGDSHVRGIVNLYPDPVSRAVVGHATGQQLGSRGDDLGIWVEEFVTMGDPDWWQTSMLLDLPQPMASGSASLVFSDSTGISLNSMAIEILPGVSNSNLFDIYYPWGGTTAFISDFSQAIGAMERAENVMVSFSTYQDVNGNDVVPYSIQVEFSHTPDVGKAWVVNPRGDLKSIVWSDDGANLKVMITPANGKKLDAIVKEKFYISGGITGLSPPTVKAYDINGNRLSGITATIQ